MQQGRVVNPHHFFLQVQTDDMTSPVPAMNGIHLAAREVQDEEVKAWIAAWASDAEREGLQDDHRRALQGALTNFANVLEKNLSTPGTKGGQFTGAFITCIKRIEARYDPADHEDSEDLEDSEDFDDSYCGDPNTSPVCNYSYYDDGGDPFDPENGANWDGDQQVGFRD